MRDDTPLLDVGEMLSEVGSAWRKFTPELAVTEVGMVTSVSTGIATVSGLPGTGFEELLEFPGGLLGIAFDLNEDDIGVVLLGDHSQLLAGDEVVR